MLIYRIRGVNFRNYASFDVTFSEGFNILVGMNAQGKSGILEAVYMLATSKSHRTSRDMDMIRLGEPFARVVGDIKRTARNDCVLEMILSRSEKKSVKVDGVRHERIADIIGQLNAVVFSNSDIDMIKGEPSLRRRFLNLEISQTAPKYAYSLARYKRVLDQRNNLLKEIKFGSGRGNGLDEWELQLAQYGAEIIIRRSAFVEYLAQSAASIYAGLTAESEELGVKYKSNLQYESTEDYAGVAQSFKEALAARRDSDIQRGTTTVGPHRDDILLSVNKMPVREFGSQGQQRTAAIALKLAEIGLLERETGENPVVLLDDVMAELDSERRKRILDLTMGRCQTIVTATGLDEVNGAFDYGAAIFDVKAGTVKQR